MSIARTDEGLFHAGVTQVISSFKFGFLRGGGLRIEVSGGQNLVELEPAEAEALGYWILEQVKGKRNAERG